MSLSARREMLISIRQRYLKSSWTEKGRVLDGFIAVTGYDRKYAISLLHQKSKSTNSVKEKVRPGAQVYDEQFRQVLLYIWYTANQVCSKRLVPFLPDLVAAMERHGHLRINADIRHKLEKISAATVDRLLQPERRQIKGGISRTKPGSLLKNQIQVRTFADWDDVTPGFFEIDLVAHCGGDPNGAFLNTLVMIDVSTGWLECMPLLKKSAADVINGISVAIKLMPFELKGLDTDSGSEFINLEMLDFCEAHRITFTRARAYKKNDQAYVEEKNGSVVRRLVGYDRFQGRKAWEALASFYCVLRKYVNFFQPSLKLRKKTRQGGKVSKQYDEALTPYQRIARSSDVSEATKERLKAEYLTLDPVYLMAELTRLQASLWSFAWSQNGLVEIDDISLVEPVALDQFSSAPNVCDHFRYKKPKDKRSLPRNYRTRKDPFEKVWNEIQLKLELQPESYAREIIEWLSEKHPGQYTNSQVRTLQRRINEWRLRDQSYQIKMTQLMSS